MGIKSLFGKGPLSEKKIEKIAKLASNPFAQPDVRMREMQRLFDDGSPAAFKGVLKRFASNASGAIADEDEKKWLEDALVERGPVVLEPLRAFLRSEKQVTYGLRAYRRLTGAEEAVRFFIEVLQAYGPDDYRSAEAKLQLVWQLSEDLEDPRIMPVLCEFLLDHSDDVRWAVLDLLERAADCDSLSNTDRVRVCEQLAQVVTDDDTGPRIQQRAAELLAQREWPLPGEGDVLATGLAESYFLDKKRFVRRRIKKRE